MRWIRNIIESRLKGLSFHVCVLGSFKNRIYRRIPVGELGCPFMSRWNFFGIIYLGGECE